MGVGGTEEAGVENAVEDTDEGAEKEDTDTILGVEMFELGVAGDEDVDDEVDDMKTEFLGDVDVDVGFDDEGVVV